MFFSVITKNLDWEILSKNLVNFKRWDGVKNDGGSLKNQILRGGGSLKNQILRGGVMKTNI